MANYINENSVILTEEDAEEFMNEYYLDEGYIVLEGQQAEEYLKRKQKEKREKDDERELDDRYGYEGGNRSQFDYKGDIDYKNRSSEQNPRFKTAREIENHRSKYKDVMPNRTTKSEKDLAKAREKESNAEKYADEVVKNRYNGEPYYYKDRIDANAIADAARRHYRRTHKNESSIFENIEFI